MTDYDQFSLLNPYTISTKGENKIFLNQIGLRLRLFGIFWFNFGSNPCQYNLAKLTADSDVFLAFENGCWIQSSKMIVS